MRIFGFENILVAGEKIWSWERGKRYWSRCRLALISSDHYHHDVIGDDVQNININMIMIIMINMMMIQETLAKEESENQKKALELRDLQVLMSP